MCENQAENGGVCYDKSFASFSKIFYDNFWLVVFCRQLSDISRSNYSPDQVQSERTSSSNIFRLQPNSSGSGAGGPVPGFFKRKSDLLALGLRRWPDLNPPESSACLCNARVLQSDSDRPRITSVPEERAELSALFLQSLRPSLTVLPTLLQVRQ